MPRGKIAEYPLRSPIVDGGLVGLRFTTDGTGIPTFETESNKDGNYTITQATNTYTITIGAVGSFRAISVTHSLAATVNVVVTHSASAGTITLAFSTDFDSAICDVIAVVAESLG